MKYLLFLCSFRLEFFIACLMAAYQLLNTYSRANLLLPDLVFITFFFFRWFFNGVKPGLLFMVLLGIVEDIITGTIIGITSLHYAITAYLLQVNASALKEQKLAVMWLFFTFVLVCNNTLAIALAHTLAGIEVNKYLLMIKFIINLISYPILHRLYSKYHTYVTCSK